LKRFLIGAALAMLLVAPGVRAQQQPSASDYPMDTVLSARATLIARYVQSLKVARGVAVCGETDLLTGETHTFLTIYVWRDAVPNFLKDFLNFTTPIKPGASELGVDGIPVVVVLVGSEPKIEKEPNGTPPQRVLPSRKA
jgi:hypothetical protein